MLEVHKEVADQKTIMSSGKALMVGAVCPTPAPPATFASLGGIAARILRALKRVGVAAPHGLYEGRAAPLWSAPTPRDVVKK